ncbi:hypothetical protein [Methanobacterium spitsbergense]|uniref:Uncharacterized protein n=1 Tax=Methanobacterium spitsbergense TaxID=2874285 RepID=A0A8T5UTG8_9EURY|nr:hypothetical protein [Methanobacterium spitsbergense]MBZ2164510.1 hypothetical protein [Methanobacterium spitsbergense]
MKLKKLKNIEKKYFGLIFVIVIILVAVTGGYFLLNTGNEAKYYENYGLQYKAINNATDTSSNLIASIFSSMMVSEGINLEDEDLNLTKNTNSNVNDDVDSAKNNILIAINYDHEMIKYAKTGLQKKYAEILNQQANAMLKSMDLIKELSIASKNNEQGKVDNITAQLEEINNQMDGFQHELDDMKNQDTNFKTSLEKIENGETDEN